MIQIHEFLPSLTRTNMLFLVLKGVTPTFSKLGTLLKIYMTNCPLQGKLLSVWRTVLKLPKSTWSVKVAHTWLKYLRPSDIKAMLYDKNRQYSWHAKICIKYRKHWESYVSFQLFGQIGLIWAVRNYSPNWHQFYHARPKTILNWHSKNCPN